MQKSLGNYVMAVEAQRESFQEVFDEDLVS